MAIDKNYPATFTKKKDYYLVLFPDLPEAITFGKTLGEAIDSAADCLYEALRGRERDGDPIPKPTELACYVITPRLNGK